MNIRGYGVAPFTFIDEIVKIGDAVKEEEVTRIDDYLLVYSNSTAM